MKFVAPLLALIAAVAAQSTQNAIDIPNGGFQVTAGVPLTITWSNPTSSTVTIKLQQGNATPDSGITLLTGVPASAKTATITIQADEVNSSQYAIEIIDESDPSVYNFSTNFVIAGATCVGTCDGGSSASSTTGTASTVTTTGTTSSTATDSSATTTGTSSSTETSSSSASSTSGSSSSASSTSSSATAAATTSAPSAGGAGALKAQAGLVVAFVAAVAAF